MLRFELIPSIEHRIPTVAPYLMLISIRVVKKEYEDNPDECLKSMNYAARMYGSVYGADIESLFKKEDIEFCISNHTWTQWYLMVSVLECTDQSRYLKWGWEKSYYRKSKQETT